jgi:hypothetical protein
MKKTRFDLKPGEFSAARIWLFEYPLLCKTPNGVTATEIPSTNQTAFPVNPKIAIEYFRYLSGKHEYAMLGADCVATNRGVLRVEIPHLGAECIDGNSLSPISTMITDLRAGLPDEFVPAIEQGIRTYFGKRPIPSANLLFNSAATDTVGSCSSVFELLAHMICRYFFSGSVFETREELETLFEERP